MKKVGIVTFFSNMNYGSSLQSFALKSYLNSIGLDANIIDYTNMSNPVNVKMRRKTYFNRIVTGLKHPSVILEMLKGKGVAIKSVNRDENVKQIFDAFNDRYLNLYCEDYSTFDLFITGSDQVWKLTAPGLHEIFFLRFTDRNKRVSYAASVGADFIPNYNRKRFGKYISEFKAVSVREDDAQLMISEAYGINVTQVLDPVLLIGEDFWESQIKGIPARNEDYIFCYFLDDFSKKVTFIQNISKNLKCKIVIIKSDTPIPEELTSVAECMQPTPLEFVSLLYNCKAVITDSFHGTAFAVLFKKLFWTVPRNYLVYSGQKSRLESILKLVELSNRYITEDYSIIDYSIDNSKTDELLEEKRVISKEFLKAALE